MPTTGAGNGSSLPTTGAGNGSSLPTTGAGNGSSLPTTGAGNGSSLPTTGAGNGSSLPTTGAGNGSSLPTTGAGNGSSQPLTGVGNGSSLPTTGAGNGSSLPTTGAGNGSSLPTTGAGNGSSQPTTGAGNGSSQPLTGAGNGSSLPTTGAGNGSSLPTTGAGNGSSLPTTGAGNGSSLPTTGAGNGSSLPTTGAGNGSSLPTTGAGNGSSQPTTGAGNGSSLPTTGAGNGSSLPTTGAGNGSSEPTVSEVDASLKAAFSALPQSGEISGAVFQQAILAGTEDLDNSAAGREYEDVERYATENWERLSPNARQKFRTYQRFARAAQTDERTGLRPTEYARMREDLQRAGYRDASAGRAIEAIMPGPDGKAQVVTGAQMSEAIVQGTKDLDAQAAAQEYDDLSAFAANNWQRLSPEAQDAFRTYAGFAMDARQAGQTGIRVADFARMKAQLPGKMKPNQRRQYTFAAHPVDHENLSVRRGGAHPEAKREGAPTTGRREGPPATARREDAPATARREGPPATARREGPPATARREDAPATARREGPPATARREDAPATARREGPPATARREDAPATARREGPPATARRDIENTTARRTGTPLRRDQDLLPRPQGVHQLEAEQRASAARSGRTDSAASETVIAPAVERELNKSQRIVIDHAFGPGTTIQTTGGPTDALRENDVVRRADGEEVRLTREQALEYNQRANRLRTIYAHNNPFKFNPQRTPVLRDDHGKRLNMADINNVPPEQEVPTTGGKPNPYWRFVAVQGQTATGEPDMTAIMQVRPGVDPAKAVQDLYKNPHRYAFDCAAGLRVLDLKSTLDTIGPDDFNRFHIGPQSVRDLGLHGGYDTTDGREDFGLMRQAPLRGEPTMVNGVAEWPELDPSRYGELTPGDRIYLEKVGDTTTAMQGWNGVFLRTLDNGSNEVFLAGKGIVTVDKNFSNPNWTYLSTDRSVPDIEALARADVRPGAD